MSKKLSKSSKGVAHHTPGRTRIKVPKAHRKHLHRIKEKLANTPGVTSVEVNHDTGSILVHHEHEMPIFEVLHKTVETVGTDLLTTLIEGESAELLGPLSILAAGVGLVATVGKTLLTGESAGSNNSSQPALLSGEATDLKTLVPTAFLLAAAYKAYETRSFWHGITPLALAYWAFDSYWKLNVGNPKNAEPKNGQVKETQEAKHG